MSGIGRRFTRIPWRSELSCSFLLFALLCGFGVALLDAFAFSWIGSTLKLGQMGCVLLSLLGECLELSTILLIVGVYPPGGMLCRKLGLRPLTWRDFRAVLIGVGALLPVSAVSTVIWQTMLESIGTVFQKKQELLVAVTNVPFPVLVGIGAFVIVLVPVCEEILFRRLLFGLLRSLGFWTALVGGAALFSAAHLFLLGAPSLFLMGIAFQLVYLWRRNLAASMLMHSLVNLLAILGTLLESQASFST